MDNDKEKLMVLKRLSSWCNGVQKDVDYIVRTFERTFQQELKDWEDNIEYTLDSLQDLDSTLDCIIDYIAEAKKELTKQ